MTLLLSLLALLLIACGGSGAEDRPPLRPIGWGPADVWHTLPASWVDEAADKGLKFIVTEHFPTVQAADWRKGQPLQSFPAEAKEWNRRACANGQTHIVFLVNWNVLPHRAQPDSWFANTLNQALSIYDPSCTWLEPLVEPDEGDLGKAKRWLQLAADAWQPPLIIASAAAGWGIRGDYIDYHPSDVQHAEYILSHNPPGTLMITDGGTFSHPPSILPSLPHLAALSIEKGIPLIVYTDRYSGPHEPILEALKQ